MKGILVAGLLVTATLSASLLPMVRLNERALQFVQTYMADFESKASGRFARTGKLWIDEETAVRRAAFQQGKPVVLARQNQDIEGASIHHLSGAIRVPGVGIEAMRRVMRDYPNYPRYFKPDVGNASGILQSDSSRDDEHYETHLLLTQRTIWFDVAFETVYDTHYKLLDPECFTVNSRSLSIRERRIPNDPGAGTYPVGDDHGFIWKTGTYWFARHRDGGLDLQVDSIALSRPVPTGFAWYGTKRAHDAVEKMLRDTKVAIEASR